MCLAYGSAVACLVPVIEEHLPALQFIAHGIERTVQFPCNSADGPLVAQASLNDDAVFEGQMFSFLSYWICDRLYLIHSNSPCVSVWV